MRIFIQTCMLRKLKYMHTWLDETETLLQLLYFQAARNVVHTTFKMSYSSRFTSNRFSALAEDYTAPVAPPVAAAATRTWTSEADTVGAAAAARSALSTSSEYKSPSNIFRRGNGGDATSQMPGAFQGMRSGAGGWQTAGYRGLHNSSAAAAAAAAAAAPPPPKTYEENFPSLGGKPAKAATAPPPKKDHAQNFANLAKSWATTTAEEEAVAAAQRAEREKEANRQAYNDDIYHKLMVRRAAAVTTGSAFDEPDYNDEFYPTQEPLSHDEYEGRPYSPHSPPYSANPDEEWSSNPANAQYIDEHPY
jgi:hypothetical protein